MRRGQQIWVVLGGIIVLSLFTSLTSRLTQQPGIWTSDRYLRPLDSNITTLTDGTFTFRLDRSAYDAAFPHLQRYTCREEIAPEGLCQGPAGAPLLLLAVKSHPASGGRRAALRRTWARPREMGGFRLRPVFLMATASDHRHARLVQLESDTFGDVLMWDFVESHHNLSLKERCFLQWLHRHCPQAAYVFKGDDDLFVNLKALTVYLSQTPNASCFIHGNIQNHSTVMRRGKYAVPQTLYSMGHYPNFASGGGFIMPGASVAALYAASLRLPVFPLDDVYLGFLTLAAGLPHQHDSRFRVWGIPEDKLQVYRGSLTVHGVSMERMEQVWQAL
ncbi:N-acetyllactosaminide beta-1,3-N-acetylglucosaminyltransferase 3-like [Elgaria multicarinata webbii]|uniref:N-acetyllactosaminide beta-1,3-N-acetylglucosaminyltransferase 3-like n=1 Tax=Elgaria multicarinata webbii TaxID=159646 RepID=UPI002FCCE164